MFLVCLFFDFLKVLYMKRHEIRILGSKRSGHHLVQNWIASAFERPAIRDNVDKPGEINSPHKKRWQTACCIPWQPIVGAPAFIYSFETRPPSVVEGFGWLGAGFGFDDPVRRTVVVARDPANQFASYLQMEEQKKVFNREFWRHWISYISTGLAKNWTVVNYNLFVRSPEYRRELERLLGGISCNDDILQMVSRPPSSFTGDAFDGCAQEMPVEQRWLALREHAIWREWMAQDEVRETAGRLWMGFEEPFVYLDQLGDSG